MSGEERLAVPGQVWVFRFLLPFPLFPRENRSSRHVCLARPSVIFKVSFFCLGISQAPGSPLGTSPGTRAKVTLVHRSHTQQNKGKQVSFF